MGRSQRHILDQYGSTANGEVRAQGAVATALLAQVMDDPTLDDAARAVRDASTVVVPMGPAGGPLQGSSMTGAFPEDDAVLPPIPPVTPDREFPIGPFNLVLVEVAEALDRVTYFLTPPVDIHTADTVTIEATGSTNLNGDYTVDDVIYDEEAGTLAFVVMRTMDSMQAPIANKGRVTITGGTHE